MFPSGSIEAVVASPYGPLTDFLVTGPLDDTLCSETSFFLPLASQTAQLTNSSPLPGLALFSDRLHGWLMAVADSLAAKNTAFPLEQWPPLTLLNGPEKLPDGVSFVWTLPFIASETVQSILSRLEPGQTTLVVGDQLAVFEFLAHNQTDQTDQTDVLAFLPAPTRCAPLDQLNLTTVLAKIAQKRVFEAQTATKLYDAHKEAEHLVAGQLEQLTRSASLERSLKLLKNEANHKKADWERRESSLQQARSLWNQYGLPPKGISGLIGRQVRQERAREAKIQLERAENGMREARLEMESLLSEIKTVDSQLSEAYDRVKNYPPAPELEARLSALRAEGQVLLAEASRLALRPSEHQQITQVISGAKTILAPSGWTSDGRFDPLMLFDNVIIVFPNGSSHLTRASLAAEALRAKKRLVVAADFSSWLWLPAAPTDAAGCPAWFNFMAAENLTPNSSIDRTTPPVPEEPSQTSMTSVGTPKSAALTFLPAPIPSISDSALLSDFPALTSLLGPLPNLAAPGGEWLAPNPGRHSWLTPLRLGRGLARLDVLVASGPTIRAFGENGPASLGTAAFSVRLALEALRKADNTPKAQVYILTPSPTQTALVRSLLDDLGRPENIFAGEPGDFENWPRVGLVIIDTALAPPQATHPWGVDEIGRSVLIKALALTSGALIVTAHRESAASLTSASFLSRLWKALENTVGSGQALPKTVDFPDALKEAKDSVVCSLEPFSPAWWPQIAASLVAALRRKVKVTMLAGIPNTSDSRYSDAVIRELRLYGANIILSKGFTDLFFITDGHIVSLSSVETLSHQGPRASFVNYDWPKVSKIMLSLLQYQTITDKLSGSGLRNCPSCGWPFVLVNSKRPRNLGDRQALKLGCLNPDCTHNKKPRRLDERWPFAEPPVCQMDQHTHYRLQQRGKRSGWVCPKHPNQCPSFRTVPGDCPSGQSLETEFEDDDE
jgi:hypothetical protein